jgi:hypothetical protein
VKSRSREAAKKRSISIDSADAEQAAR